MSNIYLIKTIIPTEMHYLVEAEDLILAEKWVLMTTPEAVHQQVLDEYVLESIEVTDAELEVVLDSSDNGLLDDIVHHAVKEDLLYP